MRLAKRAKVLGVPVLYFITPQVWAWRAGRIEHLKRYVDRAAVIFPFERPFLEQHGYTRARFVGHPFVAELSERPPAAQVREHFCESHNLRAHDPILAIFPGSRRSELKRHLPTITETVRLLHEKHPLLQFCFAATPSLAESISSSAVTTAARGKVHVIAGDNLNLLQAADAGLIKSGTNNVQAAFLSCPCAVFFNASKFSEFVARRLVTLTEVSMVNIIRKGSLKELLQDNFTAQNLAGEAGRLLFDKQYRKTVCANLASVVTALKSHDEGPEFEGCRSAYERTARMVAALASQK